MVFNNRKVAIVTGSNAGVGYALVEQLLRRDENLLICMLCRNKTRTEDAKKKLLKQFPNSLIETIIVDVADVLSVLKCAEVIKSKYPHIDYCYLNAGIMPNTHVDWTNFLKKLFSKDFVETLITGNGILYQDDSVTSDGLNTIFATNLFGHFLLIDNLIENMGGKFRTQIIWTSSSNANKNAFNSNDIQHSKGREAYSSSKYAIDLISFHLNSLFNDKNIYSHSTCPGLVMSNLTYSIVPQWSWWLIFPFLILLRIILPSMTLWPENGSHALFWLTEQDAEKLKSDAKFYSRTTLFGQRYVQVLQNKISNHDAEDLYSQLQNLKNNFLLKINTNS